jgi:tetratricopeptide (TPR) repeat protein
LLPQALRPVLDRQLQQLARKQLLQALHAPQAEPVFRFAHLLVRDTIYGGMLKRTRAQQHVAFVEWVDRLNLTRDRALESQAILGYHLEQAYRHLGELGPHDEASLALGRDAAQRLAAAGRRALGTGDMHAAANLLRRAAELLPPRGPQRLALLPDLGEALMECGELAQARLLLTQAQDDAGGAGQHALAASLRNVLKFVELYSGESGDWAAEALRTATESIAMLEAQQADDALATAWRLVARVHGVAGRYGQATTATEHYRRHAQQAGNERLIARSAMGMAFNLLFGPTPAAEGIAACEQMLREGVSDRITEAGILCALGQLRAMTGEFEPARQAIATGRALLHELGQGLVAASTAIDLARVELLAGDLAGAERQVRADYEFLQRKGESYYLATVAAMLARLVRDQGRDVEATALCQAAEGASSADDNDAQALWRAVLAPIAARGGDVDRALALASAALDIAGRTEAPVLQADARAELAGVLVLAGRPHDANLVAGEATALYERKGDIVSAARMRAWVATQR